MYRIRPGCAAYAWMNISANQARRMMYIGEYLQGEDVHLTGHKFMDDNRLLIFHKIKEYRNS